MGCEYIFTLLNKREKMKLNKYTKYTRREE